MRHFADLIIRLDQSNKTTEKVAALTDFFREAPEHDKLWAMALLSHRRPKRTVTTTLLRQWAAELSNLSLWFFEETYHIVGDLAEAIALVLPPPKQSVDRSLSEWIAEINGWADLSEEGKRAAVTQAWMQLDTTKRFILNKLITGGFRMGVSQKLMTRSLSRATGIEEHQLAHRLMGNWHPDSVSFETLVLSDHPADDSSRPYPFFLAHPLEQPPQELGHPKDWLIEHKWDGIRGQLIVRGGDVFLWSRGEELLTNQFPEFYSAPDLLPNGTVLDGEILPYIDNQPLPFQDLQTRISRKNITAALLRKTPVIFMAYDLLEDKGADLRQVPLHKRRELLTSLHQNLHPAQQLILLSETVSADNWETIATERQRSRELGCEGLMLKNRQSPYLAGRKRGHWWKWKIDPLHIDGVMIYAQRGHGRRANLYTDFTFAVWDNQGQLVPFTKAYSGLTDEEFRQITRWVQRNTLDRFGPVRQVRPELVFELAFEGIQYSSRHKSGIALRFPRIKRWRKDKPPAQANTLDDLKAFINS